MGSYAFQLNGAAVEAHPAGGLWWPARRVLAVADMHLEKGSAYARRSLFLPPYDSAATVARLAVLVQELRPDRVIAMGDTFHDAQAVHRLDAKTARHLTGLSSSCDWIWLTGNHDPGVPCGMPGKTCRDWVEGPLIFRHEPTPRAAGEAAGHLHPKLRVSIRGRSIAARCFVTDGRQIILPAFGALTGGLSARAKDVQSLFQKPAVALLLGSNRVHPVTI